MEHCVLLLLLSSTTTTLLQIISAELLPGQKSLMPCNSRQVGVATTTLDAANDKPESSTCLVEITQPVW